MKIVAEYIWTDAYGGIRSKSKNFEIDVLTVTLSIFSEWNYDGSSTGQAHGSYSDVVIRPVAFFKDPFRKWTGYETYLVLCDTYNMNGEPHETNTRYQCKKVCEKTIDSEPWFGIEQEYVLFQAIPDKNIVKAPLGWFNKNCPNYIYPEQSHGVFYCGVGSDKSCGRPIVEKHYEYCLYAGIGICGINAEVMCSQWEFQIFCKSGLDVCDHLIVARYILSKVAEEYAAYVDYSPKLMDEWNGSGAHTNFSTNLMRNEGGYEKIISICKKMENVHKEHLQEYGDESNMKRLTGHHETSSYEKYTYGESDRSASVRIPYATHISKKGYVEDRRPSANCDPYKVVTRILCTICDC